MGVQVPDWQVVPDSHYIAVRVVVMVSDDHLFRTEKPARLKIVTTYRMSASPTVIVVRSQVRALSVARRLARIGANTGAR